MDTLNSPVRNAAVAGQFYPGKRDELERAIKNMIGHGPARSALGVIVPHAGYIYSGPVAGEVYGAVELPDTFIILGPNHTGLGPVASIMTAGIWNLPGGEAYIDSDLAKSILENSTTLAADESAHVFEHSIEVQIPFLQYMVGNVNFVPISLMLTSADSCRDVGEAIATALKGRGKKTLIVASSDMTHYESQAVAQEKDNLALERVLALDPDGLLDTVHKNQISMCGAAPAAAMLYATLKLGASEARLQKYQTSGDVTGDYSQVVGYAGVIIS
ncbi:MAG: AmmeMemoRadiSam system protein B [Thermoleophilia bacterium]